VLDPFCGSGTTIVAAERHQRRWIACDTSKEAIEISSKRLIREFGQTQPSKFVVGDSDSVSHITVNRADFKRVAVRIPIYLWRGLQTRAECGRKLERDGAPQVPR